MRKIKYQEIIEFEQNTCWIDIRIDDIAEYVFGFDGKYKNLVFLAYLMNHKNLTDPEYYVDDVEKEEGFEAIKQLVQHETWIKFMFLIT